MSKYTFRLTDEQIIYVIEESRTESTSNEEKTINIVLKINNRFSDKFILISQWTKYPSNIHYSWGLEWENKDFDIVNIISNNHMDFFARIYLQRVESSKKDENKEILDNTIKLEEKIIDEDDVGFISYLSLD